MKSKIILTALTAVLFFSCKKEQQSNVANDVNTSKTIATQSINSALIREVTSLPTYSERKSAYVKMLSDYEKYTVWNTRFQDAISSHAFNAEQLGLIKEVVAKVTPVFFTDTLVRNTNGFFFADWKIRAKEHFSLAQLKYLLSDIIIFNKSDFVKLGSEDITIQQAVVKTMNVPASCGCSMQSDWCGTAYGCYGRSCSHDTGCGTLLQYDCNGLCY
ncbi:bacteriocin fulvocin C-related protein [Mucilaginibacter ginkgonis]|uniref:bacteriocin fulvocin C-related protein n=1 Tax=Mucilaginibacter ginkgonis TaxID=2682091 RepID=UPI0012FAFC6D|nr:bacteriocin fulvocin C-related protein [Mucilaginibacter ginkgonis]